MRYVYIIFWLLVLCIGAGFASLNAQVVDINIFIASYHIFLPLLLVIVLALGVVCGLLTLVPRLLFLSHLKSASGRKIRRLEAELLSLKAKSTNLECID
jgi:uncharacterized membrane protein YciS (DUF1049 family)